MAKGNSTGSACFPQGRRNNNGKFAGPTDCKFYLSAVVRISAKLVADKDTVSIEVHCNEFMIDTSG